MPKKKKDQFVIAYIADLVGSSIVVDYARSLSGFLGKGLILLFVCDKRYTKTDADEAQERLTAIKNQYPGEDISFCVLKGRTREIINLLPTMLNGVVVVAGVDRHSSLLKPTHPRRVMHDFAQCKIAYLTVQNSTTIKPAMRDVALRIDYNRESKEKLIWSSYFARFNKSHLHVLHESYSDSGLRTKFDNNMLFLDKFFSSLGVSYSKETMPTAANFPDRKAAEIAHNKSYDLMVCVTTDTREHDLLDWLIGVQDTRVVKNKQGLPVLFINPRDDIYVLCD